MYGLEVSGKDVERDCHALFKDKVTAFWEIEENHEHHRACVRAHMRAADPTPNSSLFTEW